MYDATEDCGTFGEAIVPHARATHLPVTRPLGHHGRSRMDLSPP